MEQWEKNYYITAVAGIANGSSLVVMSKGWFLFKLYILAYVHWQFSILLSANLGHGFQTPSIRSNHTKLVIHFLSNGLKKSGRRNFL